MSPTEIKLEGGLQALCDPVPLIVSADHRPTSACIDGAIDDVAIDLRIRRNASDTDAVGVDHGVVRDKAGGG